MSINGHKKINSLNNFSEKSGQNQVDKKISIESFINKKETNLDHAQIDIIKQDQHSKPKSRQGKHNSGLILAMDNRVKLSKFPKHIIPVSFKNKHDEIMHNSKDRASRRSNHRSKANKWKLSPYKKKLAAKLTKLKNSMNETPGKTGNSMSFKRKRFTI